MSVFGGRNWKELIRPTNFSCPTCHCEFDADVFRQNVAEESLIGTSAQMWADTGTPIANSNNSNGSELFVGFFFSSRRLLRSPITTQLQFDLRPFSSRWPRYDRIQSYNRNVTAWSPQRNLPEQDSSIIITLNINISRQMLLFMRLWFLFSSALRMFLVDDEPHSLTVTAITITPNTGIAGISDERDKINHRISNGSRSSYHLT